MSGSGFWTNIIQPIQGLPTKATNFEDLYLHVSLYANLGLRGAWPVAVVGATMRGTVVFPSAAGTLPPAATAIWVFVFCAPSRRVGYCGPEVQGFSDIVRYVCVLRP